MTNIHVKLTEFSDLITRYTADFVGREWLVEQVNSIGRPHDPLAD